MDLEDFEAAFRGLRGWIWRLGLLGWLAGWIWRLGCLGRLDFEDFETGFRGFRGWIWMLGLLGWLGQEVLGKLYPFPFQPPYTTGRHLFIEQ